MSDVTDRAKAALEGVTKGPWDAPAQLLGSPCTTVFGPGRKQVLYHTGGYADAQFIAAARQLVPDLVAENERLEAEVARLTPRRIDTAGELDALLIGSVIRTTEGRIAIKNGEHWGNQSGYGSWWDEAGEAVSSGSEELDDLPAVVLWSPGGAS